MLLKTIMFDSENPNWIDDREYNYMFLRTHEEFINDTVRYRGYMYLNQICETLGIKWNPDDENPCVKNDGVDRLTFIRFEIFGEANSSFLVHIYLRD